MIIKTNKKNYNMKNVFLKALVLISLFILAGYSANAQTTTTPTGNERQDRRKVRTDRKQVRMDREKIRMDKAKKRND